MKVSGKTMIAPFGGDSEFALGDLPYLYIC